MTFFLTEKSIDDMIGTKRNGIKNIKRKSMNDRKKKHLIWKVEAVLFGVVLLVFGAIFAATHAGGADPTSGQCTVS